MMGVRKHLLLMVAGLLIAAFASSCSTTQTSQTPSKPNNAAVDRFNAPGNLLISDQFNNRVVEVAPDGHIVWTFGSGNPASCNPGPGSIIGLNDAERLSGGLTLLAGSGIPAGSTSYPKGCVDNRVIVVDQHGTIVWQYNQGLSGAAFASRLPNGDTLIADSSHSRILEVTPTRRIVFEYFTNADPASNSAPLPTNAVQLANGGIMIADQFNDRVLEINSQTTFQYGTINVTGDGPGQLNGPYTAYVVGDYTGQTPPPATF